MANVMEIDSSRIQIKFIKHAIITGAKLEFRAALEPLAGKFTQPKSHFVHLALHTSRIVDGNASNAFEYVADQI